MLSTSPLILTVLGGDDSPESAIIKHVAQLALSMKAEVVLFRSIYQLNYAKAIYELSDRQRKSETRAVLRAREQLQQCADTLRTKGLDVENVVNWRMPHDMAFKQITRRLGPELILCQRKPASESAGSDPGERGWQPGQLTDLPVVHIDGPPSGPLTRTVWAAIDPMCTSDEHRALNDRVIKQAGKAASLTGSELHLVHCYSSALKLAEIGAGIASAEYLPASDVQDDVREQHLVELTALAERHGLNDQQIHNLPGLASVVLPELALRKRPDIVFAGANHRGFVSNMLLGSTVKTLMRKLPGRLCIVDVPKHSAQSERIRVRPSGVKAGANDREAVLLTNMVRIARQTHLLTERE